MKSQDIANMPRALLPTLGLFAITICVDASADTLGDIPDNTWVQLETITEVSTGILAFSGMALDSKHQKLLLFGGGHNDYWGNDIWAFDIPTLQWTRMYEPDPRPDTLTSDSFKAEYPGAVFYPDTNEPLSDARPLTRHTYDTVEFISAHGVMISTGVFTWGSSQNDYCWRCDDTWTYDVVTNKWTYRTNNNVPNTEGAGAAYDPVSDKLYLISKKSGTSAYDLSTDTWTKINTNGDAPLTSEIVAEYDSKRRCVYLFGGEYPSSDELWKYDIASNTWTKLSPTGSGPPATGGYGMAYDTVNDVLLVFKGNLWAYDPTSNVWTEMSSTPAPQHDGRVHGNFKYDSVNNVAFLVTKNSSFDIETWAYRFKGGGPPRVAPGELTELEAN